MKSATWLSHASGLSGRIKLRKWSNQYVQLYHKSNSGSAVVEELLSQRLELLDY